MTEFNVDDYSDEELKEIGKVVEQELIDRKERHRKDVAMKIRELASSLGMTPDEVLSSEPATRKKRAPVAPKYCHPDNPDQTWSGRGRQPKWVEEQLTFGKTLDDLAI